MTKKKSEGKYQVLKIITKRHNEKKMGKREAFWDIREYLHGMNFKMSSQKSSLAENGPPLYSKSSEQYEKCFLNNLK